MNYLNFINDIKTKDIRGYYIFEGDEIFLADNTIKLLLETYLEEEDYSLNYKVLDGEKLTSSQIHESLIQMPFMSDLKILVIKDFIKDHTKYFGQVIDELLKEEDYLIAIFYACPETLKKSFSLYKKLNEKNRVIEFNSITNDQLRNWVLKKIKEAKKEISRNGLELFLEYINYSKERTNKSLYEVDKEIKKLISLEGNKIEEDDVLNLTSKSITSNIFKLTDALGMRDKKTALRQLKILNEANEQPFKTLFMISRLYLMLYGIKKEKENNKSDMSIKTKLGIGNYEYSKFLMHIRNYSLKELERNVLLIADTDKIFKSKKNDQTIELIRLVSSLINSF